MKRIFCIALLTLVLCGCGAKNEPVETKKPLDLPVQTEAVRPETTAPETTEPETTVPETTAPATAAPEEDLESLVVAGKEMKHEQYGTTHYYIPVCNKSSSNVSVSANVLAKDKDGKVIGASDLDINVIGPGETTLGELTFYKVSGIDHLEYKLKIKETAYYEPIVGYLEAEPFLNNAKLIVSLTNHSSSDGQFVRGFALSMDANNCVLKCDWTYFDGDGVTIEAGETISKQFDVVPNCDHIDFYLDGRSSKKNTNSDYFCDGFTRITKDVFSVIRIDSPEFEGGASAIVPDTTAPETTVPETTVPETTQPETNPAIRAEFKEAMDAYEAFYDEYVAILQDYKKNPADLSILGKYSQMMLKLAEMDEKFEKWENSDLNSEELKYYLEVNTRVQQKLLGLI